MSYDWGPHYIVPSEVIKEFSGTVLLREQYDEDLLAKELERLGVDGTVRRVTNPWYYRKKDTDTWIKIGESDDRRENFAVSWNTSGLQNGQYFVLGLMHVHVKLGDSERIVARQNVVEVTLQN